MDSEGVTEVASVVVIEVDSEEASVAVTGVVSVGDVAEASENYFYL